MISKISGNVFQLYFDTFGSCVYVLKLNKNILIDTSSEANREELLFDLKELKLAPENIDIILVTHTHYDHTGNLNLFPNAKIHKKDNVNELNISELKVIDTPGHTSDSLCFIYKDILFSGDTLFCNGIGRTDLPTSNPKEMQKSLDKLKTIKYNILCPGHID